MAYNYGYQDQVDPELLRRAQQGPGLMAQADAGLKSLTANAAPRFNNQYGVGSLPAPLGTPSNLIGGLPSPNDYARPGLPRDPAQGNPLAFLNGLSTPSGSPRGLSSALPQAPIGADMNERIRSPLEMQAPQMASAPSWMRMNSQFLPNGTFQRNYYTPQGTASGLTHATPGYGLTVMDQGNGGTVEGNVAALNRQLEAVRSLNEARNLAANPGLASLGPQGSSGGGAFGDLVSIGRPGGNFGDEAMQAEHARSAIQRAISSPYLSPRERQTMMTGGQALAGLPTPPSVNRLPASGLGAIDPYKMAQLGIDQRKLANEKSYHDGLTALAQQRYATDLQQQDIDNIRNQSLADSLIAQRKAEGLPKPPSRDQVLGNISNDYYMTLQASRDPRLSDQERAGAASRLGMLTDAWKTLGAQQQPDGLMQLLMSKDQ